MNEDVPKLLRAMARSTDARRTGHDIIFSAAADELDQLRALAKRLSDTLLRLRPLGGSELFTKVCGQHWADPTHFERVIEEDRKRLFNAMTIAVRAEQRANAK